MSTPSRRPRPPASPFLVSPQEPDAEQSSRDSRAQWLWQFYASLALRTPEPPDPEAPRKPGPG